MTGLLVGDSGDDDDAAVAIRLARAARATEAEAWDLLADARDRAERLLAVPEVAAAVGTVAGELYLRSELSGAEIDQLLEGVLNVP